MLPVCPENITTSGEGQTPLLKLDSLGNKLGLNSLYLKDGGRNSTWSYKDRFCSVAVSKARERGGFYATVNTIFCGFNNHDGNKLIIWCSRANRGRTKKAC